MAENVPEWNVFQIGTVERFRMVRGGGRLPAGLISDDGLHREAGEQDPDCEAQVSLQREGRHQRERSVDAERPKETGGHGQFILTWWQGQEAFTLEGNLRLAV